MKKMKEGDEHAPASESMTLRYAAMDADGKLSDEAQLDERVCECCQTSAALTDEGSIAVYRDRSQSEVRDIYFVRQINGGWRLTSTRARGQLGDQRLFRQWSIGCSGWSARGRRVVHSRRRYPTREGSLSNDAGATFSSPIQVDDGEASGRVDVLMLPDGSALVCWLSGNVEGGAIKVRRVRADGTLGPAAVIAKTDISRSSGFPRMARLGNEVHFAWTEFAKPSRVRTAMANVSSYR
jgi:hypothetical protein